MFAEKLYSAVAKSKKLLLQAEFPATKVDKDSRERKPDFAGPSR